MCCLASQSSAKETRLVPCSEERRPSGGLHACAALVGHVLTRAWRGDARSAQREVARHTMDRKHWARLYKRKATAAAAEAHGRAAAAANKTGAGASARKRPKKEKGGAAGSAGAAKNAAAEGAAEAKSAVPSKAKPADTKLKAKAEPPTALTVAAASKGKSALAKAPAKKKARFVVPVPGKNGAASSDSLKGQTVVLTGVFPEIGGGTGLSLGKDRAKRLLESFGARVTSSVSGKTTLLVVGKAPGYSKVQRALVSGGRAHDVSRAPG